MNETQRKNLSKGKKIDESIAREYGRKGALKSAESKRNARTMRECAQIVANMPLNAQGIARLKRSGINVDGKDITAMMGIIYGQVNSAINGNVKSAEFIERLLGSGTEDSEMGSFVDALNNQADNIVEEEGEGIEE